MLAFNPLPKIMIDLQLCQILIVSAKDCDSKFLNICVCIWQYSPILLLHTASERPHGRYLKNVRSLFAKKWYDIGLELFDLEDESELELIKSSKLGKVECCAEMLELWLHRQPYATWNQLLEALESPGIELNNVALKIRRMLSGMCLLDNVSLLLFTLRICDSQSLFLVHHKMLKQGGCNIFILTSRLAVVRHAAKSYSPSNKMYAWPLL